MCKVLGVYEIFCMILHEMVFYLSKKKWSARINFLYGSVSIEGGPVFDPIPAHGVIE